MINLLRLTLLGIAIICCHGTFVKQMEQKPWRLQTGRREFHHRPLSIADWQASTPAAASEQKSDDRSKESSEEVKNLIDELIAKLMKIKSGNKVNVKQEESNDAKFVEKVAEELKQEQTTPAAPACGYADCNPGRPDMLNVHLVPHTHDDVGWLKTVDEYFYGARNNIQQAGVQYILDTVFNELYFDPNKRFIYVEIAFFSRWWNELHDSTQHLVKGLVNTGQLEFTLGGWCMNDEAATHYSSIIEQHTLGFRFLQTNFGECGRPRIGWQIDPFGHSREQASLFAQFGFDGLFFARLDYQDYDHRTQTKTRELMWMGSESLGDQSTLFTGVLHNGYGSPGGFCFQCDDPPIMDDPRLEDYNVDQRVNDFINAANDQAKNYVTNHIMMTMGSDFQYEDARINFKNYDKVITYVNQRQANGSKVNVFYSTPACYVYAMNQLNMTYQRKDDDFFPYASGPHTFWTGYFTSRAALKGYERTSNNFMQISKQLHTLSQLGPEFGSFLKVDMLRRALGVLQHHDGVSGTEKQHVAFDYARMVAAGVAACEEVVNDSLGKLLPNQAGISPPNIQFCQLLNVSNCMATETSKQFAIIVYNPLGWQVMKHIRLPVTGKGGYSITDSMNKTVSYQLVPITAETASLPDHAGSMAVNELVFEVMLPPLGFSTYFILQTSSPPEKEAVSYKSEPLDAAADITIANSHISLTFSGTSGVLTSMTNIDKSITIGISQSLSYYYAYQSNNDQSSGAYAFRPNGTDALPITTSVMTSVVQGTEVQEVHQRFSDWSSQVYRLYKNSSIVEVEFTVGHIPVDDRMGKEIISRYTTSLNTQQTFYTDANGREVLKRVRDYRPTWPFVQTEPVAGNYYPINSRIYIQDLAKNTQLTVLTDRSQGGGSIRDGQLEIMVHRRLLYDDHFGVGEPLNEPGLDGKGLYIRGKHYLLLNTIQDSVMQHREMSQRLYMEPVVGIVPLSMSPAQYGAQFKLTWSALSAALPSNVHLLTLDEWHSGYFLLRLEHFYQKNESGVIAQPAQVSLKNLFVPLNIVSIDETTLGGNQMLATATRLQWNVAGYGWTQKDMKSYVTPLDPINWTVTLQPMQIRTFLVTVKS